MERRLLLSAAALSSISFPPDSVGGENPLSQLVMDSSGNLFGTTSNDAGGGNGAVFEITAGSHAINYIASFNGLDGANPLAGVVLDSSGDLFGTTSSGGENNDGTVFEIVHGTTSIITVAAFDGTDGAHPQTTVAIDSSGDLFGTTPVGQDGTDATVFEVPHGSSTIKTLATVPAESTRGTPTPVLGQVAVDSSGDIFGTIAVNENPTVFEIKHNTAILTTVASFNASAYPVATVIVDSSGNLFGTLGEGGTNNLGSVYEIARGANTLTTLASFNGSNNGEIPDGNLFMDSRGDLFGTTQQGGANGDGTVFEVPSGQRTIKSLASFSGTTGQNPAAGVAVDSSGNIFGTTVIGGTYGYGTAFEIASGKSTITTLVNFENVSTAYGANPIGGMVFDSSGDLFGTTSTGGPGNGGTVFEIAKGSTTVTTIASFSQNGASGTYPVGDLAMDSSGDLFGATEFGGTGNNAGTIFEVSHGTHTLTVLFEFQRATGDQPASGVRIDAAGDLFATTQYTGFQGPDLGGSVVELPFGASTTKTLAIIPGGLEAGVTLDSNGDLFGVTARGGTDGDGSVFEIANGNFSTIASFDGSDGRYPATDVVIDPSGDISGTTAYGGSNDSGTLFEIKAGTGVITTLANLANGQTPAGLTLNAEGDLFGTLGDLSGIVYQNNTTNVGSVFEIPHGTTALTTLATFNGINGANPGAAPTLDSNGDIFGTTENGGSSGGGTVFEIPAQSATPLTGTVIGTSGSYQNAGNTASKAFDSNLSTFFDAPTASGSYAGLDLGSAKVITQISYAPRSGFASRMVGGVFQASNSATFSGGNATLYTITSTPPAGVLTTVAVSNAAPYRYVRYVGPANSYCNIAEAQFFGTAPAISEIGTSGSYNSLGNTLANAFDGNLSTYFDASTASGAWVGLNFGSAVAITQVSFAPRAGFDSRMVGGEIQASNTADFSSGVVTAYTITKAPPAGVLTTVTMAPVGAYQYWRYIGPTGSYCNISELDFMVA